MVVFSLFAFFMSRKIHYCGYALVRELAWGSIDPFGSVSRYQDSVQDKVRSTYDKVHST